MAAPQQQAPRRSSTSGGAVPKGHGEMQRLARWNKEEEVRGLLAGGRPVDEADEYGNTALHVAAQNGHPGLAKLLLDNGANPNAYNLQGNTALHFAFTYKYTDIGEMLRARGADDTILNAAGKTCYEGLG